MAYNVKNIIFGAAAIYFSVDSSDSAAWAGSVNLPAYSTGSAAAALEADAASGSPKWKHAGFTSEGVEVEYSPEFTDVEVDQLLDAALIFKTKQSVTVKTTLSEATLENLQFVWGLPSSSLKVSGTGFDGTALPAGDKEIGIHEGALGDYPVERSMAFVGAGPRVQGSKTERVYHLRRVLQTEASSFGLKRAETTMFPVSFRCLPDPSRTGSGYGTIRDRKYT